MYQLEKSIYSLQINNITSATDASSCLLWHLFVSQMTSKFLHHAKCIAKCMAQLDAPKDVANLPLFV